MRLTRQLLLGSLAVVAVLTLLSSLIADRRDFIIAASAAILAAFGGSYIFTRSVSRSVVELRDVARALAAGDLSRRPPLSGPGELGELSRALHQLAEQLSVRLSVLENEQAFLGDLFDSLTEGVVVVDARRHVVRMNAAARMILDAQSTLPFPADMLPRHRLLREALAGALSGRLMNAVELQLEGRHVSVTARPLTRGGAVLALYDVTQTRRLETVRRDFIANVSHELRTPITIIAGFAETLLDADIPTQARAQFAESIRNNAARMQRLVDDLLDLSRIESGGWLPRPADLDVEGAIREGAGELLHRAAEKKLEIAIHVAPDAATVRADPVALRQILANLVDNAIRHTSSGSITVSAARHGDAVRLAVSDTGSGIPPEHLPRIFERFYRVDSGRAREHGGTGLGLAIVKHLTEAHGGVVGAESAPGSGTTVWVQLPAVSG